MKPEIIVLISALGGMLLGQVGSIIVSFITKRYEHKGEIKKLIVTTGTEQWKQAIDFAFRQKGVTRIMPLSTFILFNSMIADLIGKGKDISEKDIKEIYERQKKIKKIVFQYSELVGGEEKKIKEGQAKKIAK